MPKNKTESIKVYEAGSTEYYRYTAEMTDGGQLFVTMGSAEFLFDIDNQTLTIYPMGVNLNVETVNL
jgi:hypothetical protein